MMRLFVCTVAMCLTAQVSTAQPIDLVCTTDEICDVNEDCSANEIKYDIVHGGVADLTLTLPSLTAEMVFLESTTATTDAGPVTLDTYENSDDTAAIELTIAKDGTATTRAVLSVGLFTLTGICMPLAEASQ